MTDGLQTPKIRTTNMADTTSQTQRLAADEEQYFRRLWPRPPRSRRLVMLTILAGSVLTLFGMLAFWQINHVFSLIDEQRQHQRSVSNTLGIMSRMDALLTRNNSVAINAIHAIENNPAADISGLQAQQVQNRRDLDAALTELQESLAVYGHREYLEYLREIRAMVEELAISRERMVVSFKAEQNVPSYVIFRDLMQSRRAVVADYMLRIKTRMEPELDASQRAIDQVLNLAFLVSCVTLGISGMLIFMLGWMLVRYVDQRDQVESHLRRATEMWIGIINTLKQGVAVYGYDQRLMLWNPRYAELQGIDPARLHVGITVREIRQESGIRDNLGVEQAIDRFVANMERVRRGETFEREMLRADGVRIQIGFHPMGDQYFVLTQTDITRIRRAEQLARDQAVRLEAIMNNVPDAIVVINSSGSIESWNAGAERLFGYREAEILHRNVSVLMPEPHAGQHEFYLRRYLGRGDSATLNRLRELTARRQDGTEFPIDLRISEMQLGDKRMFTGIIRDITGRRAMEQMKNEFISTVSHELRTPLTSIVGSLMLLVDGVSGELPPKAARLVAMAEKNSQRLARLINDILDLEKAEAGRMTLRLEVVSLLPLLQHSLELNQSYAARFGVILHLQPDAAPVLVRADEVRLLQVMANLLSNAVKNSPAGSRVLVEVAVASEIVRVTVHDSGPGIAEEFRARVFQRFAQADTSDARREAGTGLGLAITKQLIEQHGGQIGFDTGRSRVGDGRGASFWFELPAVMPAAASLPDVAGSLNMSVVLCEDDPDVAALLIEMLQLEGCRVRHTSVTDGVHALLDAQVSALLVDIDLPDRSGLNLVADLRADEQWRSLPVLVVSVRRFTLEERAAHDGLRISAWLDKPVERTTLRAALIAAMA